MANDNLKKLIDNYGRACVAFGTPAWESKAGEELAAALTSHTGEAEPVAVPLTALHLIEDAAQAHDQCRAMVHMALSLAEVYVARAAILAASPSAPIELIGQSSAATMEYLGDLLSNMDAVAEGDEWLEPIFEAAQARWPDATPPAATPAAPGEVTDEQIDSVIQIVRNVFGGMHREAFGVPEAFDAMHARASTSIRAALSHPAPVAAPPSVPQAIDQLVSTLAESKGWLRDYARGLIEDAIDRRHLEVAAPASEQDALIFKMECFIDHATGGKLSKSSWALETLKAAHDEHLNSFVNEALAERVESHEQPDYAALEREHMGDPDKQTGIYSPNHRIGWWLSAALEDPNTCEEMKADIRDWFAADKGAALSTFPEPEHGYCTGCGGSGDHMYLVGGGPDAHDEVGPCSQCGGTGAAPAPASEAVAGNSCSLCSGRGFYGTPGARCEWCKGTGKMLATPGDSADAPVQQAGGERMSFEKAMVAAGYNKPERGAHANSGYLYQRDEDRFVGWELRAALKGEQPVEPSGSERGEV